jgi:S-adenosylmethionine synthetase
VSPDNRYLFHERVGLDGPSDKMADQISDGILDAILAQDPTPASPARPC